MTYLLTRTPPGNVQQDIGAHYGNGLSPQLPAYRSKKPFGSLPDIEAVRQTCAEVFAALEMAHRKKTEIDSHHSTTASLQVLLRFLLR